MIPTVVGFAFEHPPRRPPPVRSYLRLLIEQLDLAISMARYEHRAEGYRLRLGRLWHLLTPLLRIGVYAAVFGLLLENRRPEGFVAFLAIGLFLFGLLQAVVMQGAVVFERRRNLVASLHFPRALLPIAVLLRQILAFRFEAAVMALVLLVNGIGLGLGWFLFLLLLVPLSLAFALGLALTAAVVVHHLSDASRVLPLVFRIAFYLSGVLFPLDVLLEGRSVEALLPLNPFYVYVTLARGLILGPAADLQLLWAASVAWAFASLLIGLMLFVRHEHDLARV